MLLIMNSVFSTNIFLSKHLQTDSHTLHGINQPQSLSAQSYFEEIVGSATPKLSNMQLNYFTYPGLRTIPLHPFLHLKQDP